MTKRESIETTGLLAVRYSVGLTPQGKARDAAGLPTSAVDEGQTEERFEIREGRTVASVVAEILAAAKDFGHHSSATLTLHQVATMLREFADKVEAIEETAGELLARTGLEEGDRVEIRCRTVAEQRADLAALVAGRSLHTFDGATPEALRSRDGSLVDDPAAWPEEAEVR